MEKRTSAFARILAALALVAAVVVTVVVISNVVGGNSSESGHQQTTHKAKKHRKQPRSKAATYEVKPGDTLISIAHKTGVTVVELEELNPEVDPLTLNAGETLKLR
jgi:LysM repeat protein